MTILPRSTRSPWCVPSPRARRLIEDQADHRFGSGFSRSPFISERVQGERSLLGCLAPCICRSASSLLTTLAIHDLYLLSGCSEDGAGGCRERSEQGPCRAPVLWRSLLPTCLGGPKTIHLANVFLSTTTHPHPSPTSHPNPTSKTRLPCLRPSPTSSTTSRGRASRPSGESA